MLLKEKDGKKLEKFEYEGSSDDIIKKGIFFEYLPIILLSIIAGILVIGGLALTFFSNFFSNSDSGVIKTKWIETYNIPFGLSLCILAVVVIYFCVKIYKKIHIKVKHRK